VRLLGTRYKVSKKLLEDWLDGKQHMPFLD